MKKTFFKSILCASLLVGALTSCNEVEDLYNPELAREKAKKALGLNIAPDQDWNMTSVVTANITLNEDALSDYSFRIYSGNPINDAKAIVLADYPVKTDAEGKASASFKFEMPSYLGYVYVARVDDHGRRWIGTSKIQNGVISKAFGESSSALTKAITDYEFPTISSPYTTNEVEALLANAYDLTQGLTNNQGFKGMAEETGSTVAKIIGEDVVCNYNFGFDAYGSQYKLIIGEGATWELPVEQLRITGVDIIVANGGTLRFTGKIEMANGARLIVLEGGVIENTTSTASDENINISGAGCLIYNAGTLNVNKIYADNGASLQNAEAGIWKTNTTKCAGGAGWENFINWGRIESDKIISNGNQGTLYNACLVRANTLTLDKVSLKENSAIEVPTISCNAFYLRENSIIRATTIKTNQALVVDYVGISDGKALLSTETLDLNNFPQQLDTEVYVEVKNLLNNGSYNEQFAVGSHSEWYNQNGFYDLYKTFGIGEAPLYIINDETDVIKDAECTGDGNKPNDYVEEELPIQTYTYAFEDLNKEAGDYDMNDVVLKCTGPDKDGNITIRLIAAGAEKNLYVYFNNKQKNKKTLLFEGKEIHAAFGVNAGTITNTSSDFTITNKIVEENINVGTEFLFTKDGDFYIVDDQGRESHIPNFDSSFKSGDAPYGICVPCDWKYPLEYVSIIKAYPSFVYWAGDVTKQDWYTADKAVTNSVF